MQQQLIKVTITEAIRDFIESGSVPSHVEYLIYNDSFDSGIVGDASKVVELFHKYDCELLLVPTQANWPPLEEEG